MTLQIINTQTYAKLLSKMFQDNILVLSLKGARAR
jgi:hypothetical protein